MAIWLVIGGMTLLAAGLLAWPLLRGDGVALPAPASHDVEVYRDQLREVDADRERGLIDEAEAAAARVEIERRLLRAADRAAAGGGAARQAGAGIAVLVALVVPMLGLGLYGLLGRPDLPDRPFALRAGERTAMAEGAESRNAEMSRLADQLAEKLKTRPDDAAGWSLLGRTYMEAGRYAEGAEALVRAAKLSPKDPDAAVAAGEALIYAAEGMVTPAARAAFDGALALDPKHPGARFYLALGAFQEGDKKRAYDMWVALGRDTPADAPYLPQIQEQVNTVAAELGIKPERFASALPAPPASAPAASAPGPNAADVAAAGNMSPDERMAMIRSMVQRLADRLAEKPDDLEGWTRLGRAYAVLGEKAKAADAWGRAAALAPGDAAIRAEWDRARADAGQN